MTANRTLMVMAGGTGGHVYPALAVADEMRARGWDAGEDVLNSKKIFTTEARRHGELHLNGFLCVSASLWLMGFQA